MPGVIYLYVPFKFHVHTCAMMIYHVLGKLPYNEKQNRFYRNSQSKIFFEYKNLCVVPFNLSALGGVVFSSNK